jgi:hypothetical protein
LNQSELVHLRKKIAALHVVHHIMLAINILVVVVPLWHYYQIKFAFALDSYFFTVIGLNIIAFYLAAKVYDMLSYFRKKHSHFQEKLTSNCEEKYDAG